VEADGHEQHADEPEPDPGQAQPPLRLPSVMGLPVRLGISQPEDRPMPGEGDQGGHLEVEVAGHPGGVVDHVVQGVAGVHDAPGPTRDEGEEAQHRGHKGGVVPGQGLDPAKKALPAPHPPGQLQAGGHGEGGDQAGDGHEQGEDGSGSIFQVGAMPGSAYWWWKPTGAERRRKRRKASLARGIGDELAPRLLGQDRVEEGVGGEEPEVDDGVAGAPEEGPGQQGVHPLGEAQGPGDEQEEHRLQHQADGGEEPHEPEGDGHIGGRGAWCAAGVQLPCSAATGPEDPGRCPPPGWSGHEDGWPPRRRPSGPAGAGRRCRGRWPRWRGGAGRPPGGRGRPSTRRATCAPGEVGADPIGPELPGGEVDHDGHGRRAGRRRWRSRPRAG
jgi:hypothetical protein